MQLARLAFPRTYAGSLTQRWAGLRMRGHRRLGDGINENAYTCDNNNLLLDNTKVPTSIPYSPAQVSFADQKLYTSPFRPAAEPAPALYHSKLINIMPELVSAFQ